MSLVVLLEISKVLFLCKPDMGCFFFCFFPPVFLFRSSNLTQADKSEFQLSPSLRPTGTGAAEAEKGAVCLADPPCKMRGCCGTLAAPNYYQNSCKHIKAPATGPSHAVGPGGQALQCGEATGGLTVLHARLASLPRHAATTAPRHSCCLIKFPG